MWEWCIERDIWLIPTYVCSRDNFADLLMSAVGIILLTYPPEKHTWMGNGCLILTIFNNAMPDLNFKPDGDLFASRLNKQLDKFVSFKPDL